MCVSALFFWPWCVASSLDLPFEHTVLLVSTVLYNVRGICYHHTYYLMFQKIKYMK